MEDDRRKLLKLYEMGRSYRDPDKGGSNRQEPTPIGGHMTSQLRVIGGNVQLYIPSAVARAVGVEPLGAKAGIPVDIEVQGDGSFVVRVRRGP